MTLFSILCFIGIVVIVILTVLTADKDSVIGQVLTNPKNDTQYFVLNYTADNMKDQGGHYYDRYYDDKPFMYGKLNNNPSSDYAEINKFRGIEAMSLDTKKRYKNSYEVMKESEHYYYYNLYEYGDGDPNATAEWNK